MNENKLLEFIKKVFLDDEKHLNGTKSAIANYSRKAEKEILAFIGIFFSSYATEDQIDYATARKYLTKDELKELRTIKADLDWANPTYKKYIEELLEKTRVSRIEYMQANLKSYFEDMVTKSQAKIMTTFTDNARGNISELYNELAETEMTVTRHQLDVLAKQVAAIKSNYGTASAQIESIRASYYKMVDTFVPQAFARKLTKDQFIDEVRQNIKKITNRLKMVVSTMGNYQYNYVIRYVMMQLSIKEYKYCAILDDRTSKICKELDGNTFLISQARPGVNFPPMHPNCRSFIIPII